MNLSILVKYEPFHLGFSPFIGYFVHWYTGVVLLSVGTAPDFVKKLQNTRGCLGGEAVFTIQYSAHPEPDVYWWVHLFNSFQLGFNVHIQSKLL